MRHASNIYEIGPAVWDHLANGGLVAPQWTEPQRMPSIYPLSLPHPESNNQVMVGCLIQDYFPSGPMNVTWSESGEHVTILNFPPAQAPGGLYTMSSQLTLPADQCSDEKCLTCYVQHDSNPIQDVTVPCHRGKECPVCNCQPRLSLHRPALEDLLLGSDASLTCVLSGLNNPKGATFSWQPSAGKDPVQKSPEKDSCGCYSVTSVLPGCAELWNSGETFTCTATHSEFKTPLTANITKVSENTFPPQVHLLPPPSEELALNELVSLTCLVRGFNPKEILVRWLHGSQELPREEYLVWKPLKEPGEGTITFAVTSVLRVTAAAWKKGDSFSCMVGHETLPLTFTQKTIDRLSGKPTHVNVSVIMSEADGTCY